MSSELKKEQKNKNKPEAPKEQRKSRNARAHEKKPTEKPFSESAQKVSEKSLPDDNFGPDVLKISEESPVKYSKKVIQSNWQKYEAPIDTYEEHEKIENMGADFEALLNAPISSGGHFQFKHEKTWDTPIQSTLYDKYFEINMSDLAVSLSSVPFYERNDLKMDLFSESDILSMNARSEKFNQMKKGDHSLDDSSTIILNKLTDALTASTNKSAKDKIISDENCENNYPDALEEIIRKSEELNTGPAQEDEDLEEWLDDFLVSSKR